MIATGGRRLPAVLGRLPLIRYGTTENGLNVSNPAAGPRGDTIGVSLADVQARMGIVDRLADPVADGEIQLRGPQAFSGCWNDPAATKALQPRTRPGGTAIAS